MQKEREESLKVIALRRDQSFLYMTIPKLSSGNLEDFDLVFQVNARREVLLSGNPPDYRFRPNDPFNYDAV